MIQIEATFQGRDFVFGPFDGTRSTGARLIRAKLERLGIAYILRRIDEQTAQAARMAQWRKMKGLAQ